MSNKLLSDMPPVVPGIEVSCSTLFGFFSVQVDGTEGLLRVKDARGEWVPLVSSQEEALQSPGIRNAVEHIVRETKRPVRLVRFRRAEVVEQFLPRVMLDG